jgi:hypothetical protein
MRVSAVDPPRLRIGPGGAPGNRSIGRNRSSADPTVPASILAWSPEFGLVVWRAWAPHVDVRGLAFRLARSDPRRTAHDADRGRFNELAAERVEDA